MLITASTLLFAISPIFSPARAITSPDLSVSISSSPAVVHPGDTVTYTATVNNVGTGFSPDTVFTNTLPSGVEYVSANVTGYVNEALFSVATWNSPNGDYLRLIDVGDGATYAGTPIVLAGQTVFLGTSLVEDPTTGILYASLRLDGGADPDFFELVTIDHYTGNATGIGTLRDATTPTTEYRVASMAFDSTGQLYAITGSDPTQPETLFTVDKTTGEMTLSYIFTPHGDGEAIVFGPDGLLYRASGWGLPNSVTIFQSLDLSGPTVTTIPFSGGLDFYNVQTFLYVGNSTFLAASYDSTVFDYVAWYVNTSGVTSSRIWTMDHNAKGFAFSPISVPNTCSEASGTVTCPLGFLVPSFGMYTTTATVEIVVRVPGTTTAGTVLTDNAAVSGAEPDPFLENNSATHQITVQALADTGQNILPLVLGGVALPAAGVVIRKKRKDN